MRQHTDREATLWSQLVTLVPINLLMPVTQVHMQQEGPHLRDPEYTRRKALEPTPEGSRSSKYHKEQEFQKLWG